MARSTSGSIRGGPDRCCERTACHATIWRLAPYFLTRPLTTLPASTLDLAPASCVSAVDLGRRSSAAKALARASVGRGARPPRTSASGTSRDDRAAGGRSRGPVSPAGPPRAEHACRLSSPGSPAHTRCSRPTPRQFPPIQTTLINTDAELLEQAGRIGAPVPVGNARKLPKPLCRVLSVCSDSLRRTDGSNVLAAREGNRFEKFKVAV